MANVEDAWTGRRWDVVKTGEGSNTTISGQLISIGVMGRISVSRSVLSTWQGNSPRRKRRGERESDSLFRSFHSLIWSVRVALFICLF